MKLESKIQTEGINGRHRISAVVYPEGSSATTDFGSVSAAFRPCFKFCTLAYNLSDFR